MVGGAGEWLGRESTRAILALNAGVERTAKSGRRSHASCGAGRRCKLLTLGDIADVDMRIGYTD